MAEVNWRRVFVVSSLIFAFGLVCGSIYLHLQQKSHLGRLRHDSNVVTISGVDASPDIALAMPVSNYDDWTDFSNQTQFISDYYSSEETENYDYDYFVTTPRRLQELLSDVSADLSVHKSNTHATGMTEQCLQCICHTVSECKQSMCYDGRECGIFRLSRPYWIDAGRPVSDDYEKDIELVYRKCINDAVCAARAVYAYVDIYARDCNRDGIIDCRDHIALHMLGPSGCILSQLSPVHVGRMDRCLKLNAANAN